MTTFLCSCSLNNNSFHREFYHGNKESLQTFTRMIDIDDSAPGSSLNDWNYSKYLDVLIGKDTGDFEFKEYTYKMRPGYVGIYFDISKTEIDNLQLSELEESKNISAFYSLVGMFNLYNIQNPSIKDGYSRLSFKDFTTLTPDVYLKNKNLVALISYVDVFEGENKVYTTYYHYNTETFLSEDFFTFELLAGRDPALGKIYKTYSSFPQEGTFLNINVSKQLRGNYFSEKYLNTFLPIIKNNAGSGISLALSSFRFETETINDEKYIYIPKYLLEENPESWGEYLSLITSKDNEIITKSHHTGSIEYYKVALNCLK